MWIISQVVFALATMGIGIKRSCWSKTIQSVQRPVHRGTLLKADGHIRTRRISPLPLIVQDTHLIGSLMHHTAVLPEMLRPLRPRQLRQHAACTTKMPPS